MARGDRRRSGVAGLLLLLTGLAAGVYCLAALQGLGSRAPSAAGSLPLPVGSSADLGGPQEQLRAAPVKAAAAAPVLPPPDRLSVPRLGVSAQVVPVVVSASGALAVPEDPRVLGWWNGSRPLNGTRGSIVIVGHVDSATRGKGAFFTLERATPGDTVRVGTSQQTMSYRVVARRVYHKGSLPQGIFAKDGPPYLVLITCGGPFNERTRHYRDNVVVYALPR